MTVLSTTAGHTPCVVLFQVYLHYLRRQWTHANQQCFLLVGTSNADDAVAVSSAQMQVRQLMQALSNSPGLQGFSYTSTPPGFSPYAGQLIGIAFQIYRLSFASNTVHKPPKSVQQGLYCLCALSIARTAQLAGVTDGYSEMQHSQTHICALDNSPSTLHSAKSTMPC